ncbi:MAG: hypothetical protein A2504_07675 [Bdellovibrionales bacterium RIFOXYD12_FULL_39_22]|nr:MAG: hypothetical protein A2385_11000 [Bdellovibrionales bacterium RIFOXYB1_FULL_39_21]OFZ41311.1 MAG: hypothetical protein A2485_00685 [Bdellovibrionales bacterium RIFOXYC12_FULL_39_17]OFZ45103.1 MAG: hypothetical protein A2404_11295 [Bdellovibrionales bacterium RIFOXYC1_FULL_39_130]OFZ73250.1 MAG: hypothetical protein A2451_08895 [Bdellovibrionales bacterium RIFOXYC2_FULL_39_8]OFZ74487.1 MAG: hypothetical protein A2560_11330 [Bdellovibrionales bacterium RIFOXYD1_FULL_39_84]OFZ92499.1 MAG:
MLMLGLILFGAISFSEMGVSQMPDVDSPMVNISMSLEGASPEVMEIDVVDEIESSLSAVSGIKSMSSSARVGSASITLEFDLDKDIDVAVQEIQTVLSKIQRRLPDGMDPPSIRKSNPEDQPILWISASSSKMSKYDLMTLVRDRVQNRFSTLEGVAEVNLMGLPDPYLRVWLSEKKLDQYQLTVSDVINTIESEHFERPGGRIADERRELNIRTKGEATSLEDFQNITINKRGGSLIYTPIALKEVTAIEVGTEEIRNVSRAQGESAIGIGIKKRPGSNAVKVAKAVKKQIALLTKELPVGVELAIRFDNTIFIEESISELNFTLVLSAILTSLVCWLFLGSFSSTINIVLAIPTSVIGSFIFLRLFGFTLNTFTLLGLSLAIGVVVDDAIMVLENIVRHKQMGKNKVKAALDGSQEIWLAAIATTAAIMAIFIPVAFMDGIIGKYFLQFGVTLSVAVALSLLEAITLTPMRCSRFLEVAPRRSLLGRMMESTILISTTGYKNALTKILNYPVLAIVVASLFFASTLWIGKILKKEFVPEQDQGRLMIRIKTPVGSSFAFTDQKVKAVEEYLATQPDIKSYFTSSGGHGGGGVNSGMAFVTFVDQDKRKHSLKKLQEIFREDLKKIKGARINIQNPSMSFTGGRGGFPVEFSLRGPDWNQLIIYAKRMTQALEESGKLVDVDTNFEDGMPEVQVIPNRERARARGVEIADISQIISTMMGNAVAGKYSKDGRRFDIVVGLPLSDKISIEAIKRIKIRNNRGELIRLSEVVEVVETTGLQAISREDHQRAISIWSNIAQGSSQAEAISEVQKIAKQLLPEGYFVAMSGSAKTFGESFSSLIFALLFGIVISYMILGSQFNSFIHPLTILVALPFSVSGAFIALLMGGQSLNVYSMIGLILLMGIVKKNSILLVEFTNQLKERGRSTHEALLEACPIRLRPILMTSISTVVGAIPPALAIGPGAESRIPMAIAVIGGMIVSTLLTLFIVPCVYSLLDRFTKKENLFHEHQL